MLDQQKEAIESVYQREYLQTENYGGDDVPYARHKKAGLFLEELSALGSEALGEDQMFEIMQQEEEGDKKHFVNFESNSRALP